MNDYLVFWEIKMAACDIEMLVKVSVDWHPSNILFWCIRVLVLMHQSSCFDASEFLFWCIRVLILMHQSYLEATSTWLIVTLKCRWMSLMIEPITLPNQILFCLLSTFLAFMASHSLPLLIIQMLLWCYILFR